MVREVTKSTGKISIFVAFVISVVKNLGSRQTTKRYNSGIQRAKGFLELAAALYDSSLSSESWKAAEGVLQTDSRLGNAVRLSLTAKSNDRKGLSLSFATGSFRGDQRRWPKASFPSPGLILRCC